MRSYTNSHSPRPVLIALSILFGLLFGMEGSGMTFGKIGARKMMHEWNNPYVTDGLVAMWDGQWNAGGGVHDAAATTWMDLVGTKHLSVDPSANFTSNSLSASLLQGHACAYSPAPIGTVGQIEVCGSFSPGDGWVANFIFITKSSSMGYYGIGTINSYVRTVYFKNGKRWEIWNPPRSVRIISKRRKAVRICRIRL